MRDRVHDLTRRIHDLPTLPAVYQQVEALTRDPSSSSAQLAQLLSRDPVLTARLLRVVNSARYALTERVTTVSRAISILGHRTVRDTVLVTSVLSLLPNEPRRRDLAEAFWRHAIAVGSAAQVLGAPNGGPAAEEFFTAGLLHDMGKLIWLRFFPDDLLAMHDSAASAGITLLEAELAMAGTTHVRLGRILARRWRLPEIYQDVIGFHHEVGGGTGNGSICFVVQLADLVAHALELGWPSPLGLPAVQPEAWLSLRLDPEVLPDMLEAVQAEFQENIELFPLFTNDGAAEASGGREATPAPALAG